MHTAWSFVQAITDGLKAREARALAVHGGLAAFLFIFWRKYAAMHVHMDDCSYVHLFYTSFVYKLSLFTPGGYLHVFSLLSRLGLNRCDMLSLPISRT